MAELVTFVVGSSEYQFSKSLLISKSEYFNIMFNSSFLEKGMTKIPLKDVSEKSMEHISKYFEETAKDELWKLGSLSDYDIVKLFEDATLLQLTEVQDKCEDRLMETCKPSNTLLLLDTASKLDRHKLLRRARAIALWKFDETSKSVAFYKLTAEQVHGYLNDCALHSKLGEPGVWDALNRWMNQPEDPDSHTQHLETLMKCLRVNTMSVRHLKAISLSPNVQKNIKISYALDYIIRNLQREKKGEMDVKDEVLNCMVDWKVKAEEFAEEWLKLSQSCPRKLPKIPSVVANVNEPPNLQRPCLVTCDEESRKLEVVLWLDKLQNHFKEIIGFKVIEYGEKLYVLGGEKMSFTSSSNRPVWVYDQIYETWSFLTYLQQPYLRHMSVCCTDEALYVLGGIGKHRVKENTVFRYLFESEKWSVCAPLPNPMYSVPCCALDGYIYVVERYIFQYSPQRFTWVVMDVEIPLKESFCSAMAATDCIYLVSALGKNVYKWTPYSTQLQQIGCFTYNCTEACLVNDFIYSMSTDTIFIESYCEALNIATGESKVLWKGVNDGTDTIEFDDKHHHGCVSLLRY